MSTTRNKPLILSYSEKIRFFIKDVGLPLNRAPEALGVKASDFLDWWSGHNPKLIQFKQLASLGQFLNLDEDQIIEGTYDKEQIRTVLFAGPATLPEKYSQNQFSYLRSSAHILKFLTLTRGQHFSDMIMRKLNIAPLIYKDLNNKISLNYFMDLLEVLAANGLTQNELDSLACVLFLSLGDTPLGEKFKQAKTYYECYEVLAQNIALFDSNFIYTFELDRRQIVIKSFLPFDKHSHIDWVNKKMDRIIRYRQIVAGCYPFLSKLPPIIPEHNLEIGLRGISAIYTIKFADKPASPLVCLPK